MEHRVLFRPQINFSCREQCDDFIEKAFGKLAAVKAQQKFSNTSLADTEVLMKYQK